MNTVTVTIHFSSKELGPHSIQREGVTETDAAIFAAGAELTKEAAEWLANGSLSLDTASGISFSVSQ